MGYVKHIFTPLLFTMVALTATSNLEAQTLYGSKLVGGDTISVDADTGAWTLIGDQGLGIFDTIECLAYSQSSQLLFGINLRNNSLYWINPNTGKANLIGPTAGGDFHALAFDEASGQLYAVNTSDALFQIDPSTGVSTFIGQQAIQNQMKGMAMDNENDRLYGLAGNGQVYLIDKGTGAMSPLPQLASQFETWAGLAWDNTEQRLLASSLEPGAPGDLFEINPVTGASQRLGTTAEGVHGLAHEGGPPPLPLTYNVPTLVAGQPATFSVNRAIDNSPVYMLFSLTGAGPTPTFVGLLDLSNPIQVLSSLTADGFGFAFTTLDVPLGAAGLTLYTQAVNLPLGNLSAGVVRVVQ